VRRVGFEWQIAELIDDQELGFGEMSQPLLEPTFAMSFGQLCNERGRGGELHRMPGQDRFPPERHCQVRLADAGRPEQQHILAMGDPARTGDVAKHTPICWSTP
jgi:hypothetical protein